VIRLDHEMNGNWYPWSAGSPANQAPAGEANLYVQAWQHVWNVFESVGANADVIWLWSPVRVDNIKPHSTTSGYKYETALAEDYPGDRYVDWTGMSAYQYKPTDGWTYESTFRKTLTGLKGLSAKPVFISETAATQSVGSTDYAAQKAQWTTDTLAGLAKEPDVVGFAWFNNTVNDVHKVDGVAIQTDWQFSSSAPALAAFKAGIASSAYSSGIRPDTAGG
jgi:mannan endo-1,4-beta-mannosidase